MHLTLRVRSNADSHKTDPGTSLIAQPLPTGAMSNVASDDETNGEELYVVSDDEMVGEGQYAPILSVSHKQLDGASRSITDGTRSSEFEPRRYPSAGSHYDHD